MRIALDAEVENTSARLFVARPLRHLERSRTVKTHSTKCIDPAAYDLNKPIKQPP